MPPATPDNQFTILQGGAEYFPALLAAINAAQRSIYLETYIFADDPIGHAVKAALIAAAARGVNTHLVIDGFGSGEFGRALLPVMRAQGVQMHIYRPQRWWQLNRHLFRRLHRKIAVIDDAVAFVGGINIIADDNHEGHQQLGLRFDFAVQLRGAVVHAISLAAKRLWWRSERLAQPRQWLGRRGKPVLPYPRRAKPRLTGLTPLIEGHTDCRFVERDNVLHRRSIAQLYTQAIDAAEHSIVLANAYFLPIKPIQQALLAAAARGVKVTLLLQGRKEYAVQHEATQYVYAPFLHAGVAIYEYTDSFLHAKVMCVDQRWLTIGSSNLDPFSILLAREANVAIRQPAAAQQLHAALAAAISQRSRRVSLQDLRQQTRLQRLKQWAAFQLIRLGVLLALGRQRGY